MFKKLMVLAFSGILLVSITGCFAIFAGAAAGTGTAVWLSGKLSQEVSAPYERTIKASEGALKSLDLPIIKESKEDNITQLRSKYTDGKDIWVDVRRVTDKSTKVEVRVGAVHPDKAASDKILKRIQQYI
jgi:hypothetical protein